VALAVGIAAAGCGSSSRAPASPAAGLTPQGLDFGTQLVGRATAPKSVTLSNAGSAALAIGSIAAIGDYSQGNDCGSSLAAGSSCTIQVTFDPQATGARPGTLSIADDAAGSPQTVALTGTGVATAPTAEVVPQSLAFGTQPLGLATAPQGATLSNNGNAPLAIASIAVTGDYSQGNDCGSSLAAGSSCTIQVTFDPQATGARPGTLSIADDAAGSPQQVGLSGSGAPAGAGFPGVFTYHYDNLRTGLNPNETILTPANVSQARFGKKFSHPVDGQVYTQPLYAPGVAIPGQGLHDVVYVATEHDSVYAFDADGLPAAPLWRVSFIDPAAGVTTVPPGDTGECCDLAPEIGITGTPVIDPSSGTMYLVAKTKEVAGASTRYLQRLHALDIATGAEKLGGPVVLQASVPGAGDGSSAGQVSFDPLRENQREALLLVNGTVVIAFGSHGDNSPYHGWVLGYDATTLGQVFAFNATPDGSAGGIWQTGCGPAADAAGDIYFISGNGTFDASGSVLQLGDSFTKLSPSGTVLDYFTPWNQAQISGEDFDLGSGGTLLLPDQPGAHPHLMVSAGKEGTVYLVDRDHMGHQGATSDGQIVQALVHVLPGNNGITSGNFSAPAYWNGRIYFGSVGDQVKLFTLTSGRLSTAPTSQTARSFAFPGGFPAISSNGASDAILWVVERPSAGSPGVLHAYDATDLGSELYHSNQNAARDGLDPATKSMVPTVADGKVFIGTDSTLTAFGPL
jgi:hypothetical protein